MFNNYYSEIGAIHRFVTVKQYLTNVTANLEGTSEAGFAISEFNFHDRLERGTVIYGHVAGRARTLTSVRVYLAPDQRSIRFGRILFTIGRAVAAFSDSSMAKLSALHLPFGPALPGYVLRIICLFRFPHTSSSPKPFPACVSPAARGAEYRRGCRCNTVRISGGIAKKSGRNAALALCFPLLLVRTLA